MKHSLLETTIGAVVLGAAFVFLVFSYSTAHKSDASMKGGAYHVTAAFDNIGGLKIGDAVMISGVKVGVIDNISLDDKLYRAQVRFSISREINVSVDSSARIASESLLGGKYLDLQPGGDDANLKDGGVIKLTQGASNLEDLLGRFIFSAPGKTDAKTAANASDTAPAAGDDELPAHP